MRSWPGACLPSWHPERQIGWDGEQLSYNLIKLVPVSGNAGYTGPHVQALAEIAKLSRSKAFCRALINAENAAEVVELVRWD